MSIPSGWPLPDSSREEEEEEEEGGEERKQSGLWSAIKFTFWPDKKKNKKKNIYSAHNNYCNIMQWNNDVERVNRIIGLDAWETTIN